MYDWREDIYYVTGALSSNNSLEVTRERVDDLAYAAAERIVKDNLEDDPDYYGGCDPEDVAYDEYRAFNESGATLWAIPTDSRLYDLLMEWHDGWWGMSDKIRNFFTDGDNIFFVTRMGYDIMSADLLGGTADGVASREFDKFVESHE